MKMFVLALVGLAAMLSGWSCAQDQPDFHEHIRLERAFSAFSNCLQSKRARCVVANVSVQGVVMGVDGPRLSKNALAKGLASDKGLQCFFWGTSCGPKTSANCPILSLAAGSAQYGKAYVYKGKWQADVNTKVVSRICSAETSFIFQLEKGYWRLVAIPYT